jgi:hypothetical protein
VTALLLLNVHQPFTDVDGGMRNLAGHANFGEELLAPALLRGALDGKELDGDASTEFRRRS